MKVETSEVKDLFLTDQNHPITLGYNLAALDNIDACLHCNKDLIIIAGSPAHQVLKQVVNAAKINLMSHIEVKLNHEPKTIDNRD